MKGYRRFLFVIVFVLLLIFASIFSDFLSSGAPGTQNLNRFYHPPTRMHFFDSNGHFNARPFIYGTELTDPLDVLYQEKKDKAYSLHFFFKGYRYKLFGLISWDRHLIGRNESPLYYPLGTDELGRDVLARVLAGTRTSILVVLMGMVLYIALGLTFGTLAGLLGGWVDALLMRFSEFVLALPALYLVLAMRSVLPMNIAFWETLLLTVGTIAAVVWPPLARGVRGLIVQLKGAMYIEAAHSLGGTPMYIFRRHMLPSLLPFTLTQTVVAAPVFLLGEVILSFLNVGFHSSGESWGAMLRNLKDTRVITDFWWNLLPLFMVFLTLLFLNILSSRLHSREARDQFMRI
jgi:peptide/nickel transport system permease protein